MGEIWEEGGSGGELLVTWTPLWSEPEGAKWPERMVLNGHLRGWRQFCWRIRHSCVKVMSGVRTP